MCAYCRTFIPNYAFLEKPLRALTTGKGLRSCDKIERPFVTQMVDAVSMILQEQRTSHLSTARWLRYHTEFEVVKSGKLPSNYSAQAAELVALTEACNLMADKCVTIYTDSRYAFGVTHRFWGTLEAW